MNSENKERFTTLLTLDGQGRGTIPHSVRSSYRLLGEKNNLQIDIYYDRKVVPAVVHLDKRGRITIPYRHRETLGIDPHETIEVTIYPPE